MKEETKRLIFLIGLLLFLEGVFIQTDFSQFGIPSVFIGTLWLHHWIVGVAIMVWAIR